MRTSQILNLSLSVLTLTLTACSAKLETPMGAQIPDLHLGDNQIQTNPAQPSPTPGLNLSHIYGKKFSSYGMFDILIDAPVGDLIKIQRNCNGDSGTCLTLGQTAHENFELRLNDANSKKDVTFSSGMKGSTEVSESDQTLQLTTQITNASGAAVETVTHALSYSESPCGAAATGPAMEDNLTIRDFYPDGYSDQKTCFTLYSSN